MIQNFDYELRLLPTSTSCQDTLETIPVSRFFLSQRSLFFRAAFTFPSSVSASYFVINLNGLDSSIFKSFINCLHNGHLEFDLAELIDWYALAEYYECTDLKKRLVDIYQVYLVEKKHCRALIRAALESDYFELLTVKLLVKCINYWCPDEDLIKLTGLERLEEILIACKKWNRNPSLLKPARWAIYRVIDMIIKEKYSDTSIISHENINLFYLSAFHDMFNEDQSVEEGSLDTLDDGQYMRKINNSVKLIELWKLIPWDQFSMLELEQILEQNDKVPIYLIESFIIKIKDTPAEESDELVSLDDNSLSTGSLGDFLGYKSSLDGDSGDNDHPDDDSERTDILADDSEGMDGLVESPSAKTLTEMVNFNCWYEHVYSDMDIKFLYKSGYLQDELKVYPAHKCVISRFPKIWNAKWEGNSIHLNIKLPYKFNISDNCLSFFLHSIYGELKIVEYERNDQATLLNLLILTHRFQVTKAQEYISELLIQNTTFVWEWFVRLRANFDYFNELFPKFGPSFTESRLTAQKEVLRPMNCPNLRSAWIKLIQTASVTEAQRAQLQEFLV